MSVAAAEKPLVPTHAALRKMSSSQPIAQDLPVGSLGFPSSVDEHSTAPDAQQQQVLEQFLMFSMSSGITSLGVLLEIIHLADWNFDRAIRIAELVKQSPPPAPAAITESKPATSRAASPPTGSTSDSPPGVVSAATDGFTASAAAASQYGVAAVAVGPNSAAATVGTAAGTTTSTAVPLSAVVTIPANSTINVDTTGATMHEQTITEPTAAPTSKMLGLSALRQPSSSFVPNATIVPRAAGKGLLQQQGTPAPTPASAPQRLTNHFAGDFFPQSHREPPALTQAHLPTVSNPQTSDPSPMQAHSVPKIEFSTQIQPQNLVPAHCEPPHAVNGQQISGHGHNLLHDLFRQGKHLELKQ